MLLRVSMAFAEQLLKLHRKGVLKLTRVYSEQMEMLEFPYPGSELKLCKQLLRDEKPKRELRFEHNT